MKSRFVRSNLGGGTWRVNIGHTMGTQTFFSGERIRYHERQDDTGSWSMKGARGTWDLTNTPFNGVNVLKPNGMKGKARYG